MKNLIKWSGTFLLFCFSILPMEKNTGLKKAASYPNLETPENSDSPITQEKANEKISNAIRLNEFKEALDLGADVNSRDLWRRPPLNRVISFSGNQHNHQIIELLLKHGADPKQYDEQKVPVIYSEDLKIIKINNALHLAAKQQCFECCQLLMNNIIKKTTEQKKRLYTLLLVLHRKKHDKPAINNIYKSFQILLFPYVEFIFEMENVKAKLIPFLKMKNSDGDCADKFFKHNIALVPAYVEKELEQSNVNEHSNQKE